MAVPLLTPALATGEVSPSMYGRVDMDRERVAATTMRNAFVSFRGGATSRPGSKFVGFSRQTGRSFGPRLIPFQFSIIQGLALEFCHECLRFISNGAYVVEDPVAIGGATQADPAVLTFGAQGADSATPDNTGVTFSYAPGDLVTLDGGTFLSPAVLAVTTSELVSILPNARGSGYVVANTIDLAGGTSSDAAQVTVASVVAVKATGNFLFAANPAIGDTITLGGVAWTFKEEAALGAAETTIQATLGATLAQLAVDLNASTNGTIDDATYTSDATHLYITFDATGAGGNAFTLAASVATRSAATLTGGTTTGLGTVTVNDPGIFSALPAGAVMTQSGTSGAGAGASFQTAVFGAHAVTIDSPGAYTTVPGDPVSQSSTTGVGVGITFDVIWDDVPAFEDDDWIEISDVEGMTELNGNTYVVQNATSTTVSLFDVYGNAVDSTAFAAYVSGGIVRRIYTVATPYQEEDLEWIKYVQSADVMTLCCVNQLTGVEYIPQNLERFGATDWTFTDVVATETVDAPDDLNAAISGSGATFYAYVVTAVSPVDGTESVASVIETVQGVNIATELGQVDLTWDPVDNVGQYNIYKAKPSYGSPVPVGSLVGYIGSSYGPAFQDTNIFPDFATVPPRHKDPFARGQIAAVNMVTGGSGYTSAATATITSSSGSGAVLSPVVQNGAVVAVVVENAGHDYADTDTISFSVGTGATAALVIGPDEGTYPAAPGYFQQRRVFGYTLNQPDTYFMSKTGAYENMDASVPPRPDDAIIGSPWAVQVNGIQHFLQIASGLLTMTGAGAWILVGTGGFATQATAITPTNQDANPQPFTGISATIPPHKINWDILYVTSKDSLYYDLPYQLQLAEPIDITQYATHLFTSYTVVANAWCEQPFKLLWSVRDDGTMQSLTFLKAEQVVGWARHDTQGLFVGCCSVTEPPVDALYVATQRFPGGNNAYMIERMDNRLWRGVEDVWAVDCALSTTQDTPSATLTADLPYGTGNITGVTELEGGTGYSDGTTVTVQDVGPNGPGPGTGAIATPTIVDGVITAIVFGPQGSGYTNPRLTIEDPANSGKDASARCILNTTALFTASAAIFDVGNVGDVIRMGGGIADITALISDQSVEAMLRTPITDLRYDTEGNAEIIPKAPGEWTLSTPTMTVDGLDYLAGMMVTGLADGKVITPREVSALGQVTLDEAATAIVVGLGFTVQIQSVYIDAGAPTIQGQRKKIAAVSALVEASRDIATGSDQTDGSTLNPMQIAPPWDNMVPMENLAEPAYNSDVSPLYTGYVRNTVDGGWAKAGQAALEQTNPLPLNLLAFVPEMLPGDSPEVVAKGGRGVQQ